MVSQAAPQVEIEVSDDAGLDLQRFPDRRQKRMESARHRRNRRRGRN